MTISDISPAEALVRAMFRSWETLDPDPILAFFTDDILFENIPMSPIRGVTEFRTLLTRVGKDTSNHAYEVRNIGVVGDLVFAERIDRYQIGAHPIALPVLGVLKVEGGKISQWRDYFDRQMAGVHLHDKHPDDAPA